jgi:CHASE2 domain-containing sensor protein
MLNARTKRIIYNVLWSPGWPLGAVLTALGAAGLIGGILTWQEHGAEYVIIGGLSFLITGVLICAAVVQEAKKQL